MRTAPGESGLIIDARPALVHRAERPRRTQCRRSYGMQSCGATTSAAGHGQTLEPAMNRDLETGSASRCIISRQGAFACAAVSPEVSGSERTTPAACGTAIVHLSNK
jgi:hypothetical protein